MEEFEKSEAERPRMLFRMEDLTFFCPPRLSKKQRTCFKLAVTSLNEMKEDFLKNPSSPLTYKSMLDLNWWKEVFAVVTWVNELKKSLMLEEPDKDMPF